MSQLLALLGVFCIDECAFRAVQGMTTERNSFSDRGGGAVKLGKWVSLEGRSGASTPPAPASWNPLPYKGTSITLIHHRRREVKE
ncbi:hypothetical protein BU24DRAFT_417955 [Aaosphaeria arxii CBS 175.79]|uniref:PiggyBac transposable element-derived protein domain-containing protein n=1 Tax=Aaosphaeria arxii CBS 175.79 TaxID=1450172 RepID=A0A6A5YCK3_9PLEO|nr:uncharacterized protein BU24DRAFT_417955 [Aaosphaeria arxii CBS 175.79]KAF2022311.1 hypothetical protein BU24DRAFT_417955 [Aaosphaeria arxii CBS 175.79]